METYTLVYAYGTHRVSVYCSKDDFYEVINDLSCEFEIVKEYADSNKYLEYYYLRNYHDELELIGSVFSLKRN